VLRRGAITPKRRRGRGGRDGGRKDANWLASESWRRRRRRRRRRSRRRDRVLRRL